MEDIDRRDEEALKIIGFTYLGEPIHAVEFINKDLPLIYIQCGIYGSDWIATAVRARSYSIKRII